MSNVTELWKGVPLCCWGALILCVIVALLRWWNGSGKKPGETVVGWDANGLPTTDKTKVKGEGNPRTGARYRLGDKQGLDASRRR